MGDIGRFFNRSEFKCPCGQCDGFPVEPRAGLIEKLDMMRGKLGRALIITSGVRCEAHNKAVGGVGDSEHTRGEAVDIAVTTSTERMAVVTAAVLAGVRRIGVAKGFVHVGVGGPEMAQDVLWLYS